MKQYFGFMDETGVLSDDPQQRFFALGLLKLVNTSLLFEKVKQLKDAHNKPARFEFKFTGIKQDSHLAIHKKLIDLCFSYPGFFLTCIIIDKDKDNNMGNQRNTWDMQLELAKRHIQSSVKKGENIALIADYLTKPRNSERYFEDELQRIRKVFNACMIESDSSVFVQIVDIFIGCIVYRHKIENGLASENTPKGKLVLYIESKLNEFVTEYNESSGNIKREKNLLSTFTIFKPIHFSVYMKRERR